MNVYSFNVQSVIIRSKKKQKILQHYANAHGSKYLKHFKLKPLKNWPSEKTTKTF